MTVIAYDGKTLASDRKCSSGDIATVKTKLTAAGGGRYCAAAGGGEHGDQLVAWCVAGMNPDTYPMAPKDEDDSAILVVADSRGARTYYPQTPTPMRVEQPFMAWGSGREIAIGAMAAGATAREAVLIAGEWVNSCGLGVDVATLAQKRRTKA
jgi:hypothetical protein